MKTDTRVVDAEKGTAGYAKALAEAKQASGLSAALFLRSTVQGDVVEYEFLVGDDEGELKTQLLALRLEAELRSRGKA